jgi:hypothetical protein
MNKKLFQAFQETWSNENEFFLKHLKESIWIPTIQIIYSFNQQTDQIESHEIHRLDQPNNVYLKTKQIQRIFAQHVPYIDGEIHPNSSFVHDIGLIEQITLTDIISMLLRWCENSIFFTSMSHIQNMYEYIYQNMSINELRELINDKPIFFVPISSASTDDLDILRGKFVGIRGICWSDPTNLFAKYPSNNRCILEPYYLEQKSIFLDAFVIPLNPTIEEYIHLLGRNLIISF